MPRDAAHSLRIILVRHGVPDATADERRAITGRDIGRWYRRYNELGIAETMPPPPTLVDAAASAGCIVSSDLRRAMESAARLAGSYPVRIDPDLREVGFPEALNAGIALSPGTWVMLARAAWLLNRCDAGETMRETRARAGRLADRLGELARSHGSVVAVGHGWFNQFVASELRRRRWRGPWFMPSRHWSSAVFERRPG